ncbi:MAG: FecR domain-containing protein [Hymenobacteraceae bacterium]|nr:FecR domain-containing protein [Hymenobacteraceae bacterium]MDX5482047.1 FecR domain-containing protein [Hymenobacteraceae bacterium]
MDYSLYRAEDFAADESFISYHLGTDPAAVAFWESWISHHPEKLDEILTAEHLVDLLHLRLTQAEAAEERNRMLDFLQDTEEPRLATDGDTRYNTERSSRNIGRWVSVLVICAVLLLAFLGIRRYTVREKAPVEWLSSSNPAGKRSIIQLSDGSTVTLNANSTLFYPKVFRGDTRELMLTGEAFFEVAKNPQRPFIVRTGKLTTTVLGTKFNVSAASGSPKTQVALVEGSVKIKADQLKGEVILHPSQQVTYSEKDNSLTTSAFAAEEVLAWKNGTLIFKEASFQEVAEKLYQTYGITLKNHSPKQVWSYSGKFEKADYLTVIKSICYAKRLTYTVERDTVIIR